MKCCECQSSESLICQHCHEFQQKSVAEMMGKIMPVLQEKRKLAGEKEKSIDVRAMGLANERKIVLGKIGRARGRIQELRKLIQEQKRREERLMDVKRFYKQNLVINQSEVQSLYLQDLTKRNATLKQSLTQEKKEKKNIIDKLLKVYGIDQKKYKIQKYLRLQQNRKNIIFTLQNHNRGIPVIKANPEQILIYQPLEQNDEQLRREQERMLIGTLKVSSKLLVLMHRIFISKVKLPYKMYFSKQFLYMGNSMVCFDANLELGSNNFVNILNMLQGNVECIAFAIGVKEKPFLIMDRAFYAEFEKKGFEVGNFQRGERKWKSFLKTLKPRQIEQHYEEQNQTELIVLTQQVKSQASDDSTFQVLE